MSHIYHIFVNSSTKEVCGTNIYWGIEMTRDGKVIIITTFVGFIMLRDIICIIIIPQKGAGGNRDILY